MSLFVMNAVAAGIKLVISPLNTDEFFDNVSLLLHFDGNLTDSSNIGHTITPVNGATTQSAGALYGESLTLNGTNQYVVLPSHTALEFRDKARYTIEATVKPDRIDGLRTIVCQRNSGFANNAILLFISDGKLRFLGWNPGGGLIINITSTSDVVVGSQTAVAACIKDGSAYLFINGSLEATASYSGDIKQLSTPVEIGRDRSSSGLYFSGMIDEVRFTSGVCRYTADYLVETSPFHNSGPA